MITLKQTEHSLLGSKKSIDALASAESARILVISDSHGQRDLFRLIVETEGTSCDALVFCGDGIGDLASCLDAAAEDSGLASCVPPVCAFVEGNGDSDRFPVCFNPGRKTTAAKNVYYELIVPRRQIVKAAGHTIYAVHGHEQGVYYGTTALAEESGIAGADIVLYGHTHIADETRSGVYIVNPGSIAHPRAGTPPSFCILEIDKKNVSTVFYRIDVSGQGVQFVPFLPEKASLWI